MGCYLLTPDIFEILEKTKKGTGGEIVLADAILTLGKKRPLYGKRVDGIYRDVGTVENWLKTTVDMAIEDKNFGPDFKKYLKKVCKNL